MDREIPGVVWLLLVLGVLWLVMGSPVPSGSRSSNNHSTHGSDADPDYSSIRQFYSQPQYDPGSIRDNTVRGRARERNRRRSNDLIIGR